MLGAVGAYSWSGTVVHKRGSAVDILPSSAFEETLQDKSHSSLLGNTLSCSVNKSVRFNEYEKQKVTL